MRETDNNKKNAAVARIAIVCTSIAILCTIALFQSFMQLAVGFGILFAGVAFFSGAAIVLGLVSLFGKRKQRNKIDKALAIFSIVVPLIALITTFFIPAVHIHRKVPPRMICGTHLKGFGKLIEYYYKEEYPTPDKWCDLLIENVEAREKQFVCKAAAEGRGHYAMNPNCQLNSPNDVVLLFETKGGWNQFGGRELLSLENHKGKGCNVLFNDKTVRFIKPEEVNELNWGEKE